ncbi:hypothetical protein [Endozoicomonas sp. 8E]|uniref:hypothetical protein n=1 Tax=Endozoicomonas sp. 8E TaxID=3035692 RepID=UPI0029391E37|nr:hypothetical protein [Endozoicomonas sp. 8E]WOG30148.1 hypothetical protein P6910_10995 [Endozoicomonas sp. 8E]
MIFIISCNKEKVVFQGSNSHSSTQEITLSVNDLGVSEIIDCFYNEDSVLTISTNLESFTVLDSFTDSAGIDVSLLNSNGEVISPLGQNYTPDCGQTGSSGIPSSISVQTAIRHLSLFSDSDKKRMLRKLEKKEPHRLKLSKVLFDTESDYSINVLNKEAQRRLKEIFNFVDRNSLVSFMNYLYPEKIITEHGVYLILKWYDTWLSK